MRNQFPVEVGHAQHARFVGFAGDLGDSVQSLRGLYIATDNSKRGASIRV